MKTFTKRTFQKIIELASQPVLEAPQTVEPEQGDDYSDTQNHSRKSVKISEKQRDMSHQ